MFPVVQSFLSWACCPSRRRNLHVLVVDFPEAFGFPLCKMEYWTTWTFGLNQQGLSYALLNWWNDPSIVGLSLGVLGIKLVSGAIWWATERWGIGLRMRKNPQGVRRGTRIGKLEGQAEPYSWLRCWKNRLQECMLGECKGIVWLCQHTLQGRVIGNQGRFWCIKKTLGAELVVCSKCCCPWHNSWPVIDKCGMILFI